MLKTISVDSLKVGMFLAEPAYDIHGELLLAENIVLTSPRQIRRLKESGVLTVTIDSEKGLDCQPGEEIVDAKNGEINPSLVKSMETKVQRAKSAKPKARPAVQPAPFSEEIRKADKLKEEATNTVRRFYQETAAGRAISKEESREIVSDMIDSIMRNPYALPSLTKLKEYDEYTFNHQVNVCVLSLSVANKMGFSGHELENIGIGALLHDIGKMKIPPRILNKPGKLTDAEWLEMKRHTVYGVEILENSGLDDSSLTIVENHHEKFNGNGYLRGLKGERIPIYAQLVSICDVYDALSSRRVYKNAMLPHETMAQIYQERDETWSTEVTMAILKTFGIFPVGSLVLLNTGEIAIVISVNEDHLNRPKVAVVFSRKGKLKREPTIIDLSVERENSIKMALNPQAYKIKFEDFIKNIKV